MQEFYSHNCFFWIESVKMELLKLLETCAKNQSVQRRDRWHVLLLYIFCWKWHRWQYNYSLNTIDNKDLNIKTSLRVNACYFNTELTFYACILSGILTIVYIMMYWLVVIVTQIVEDKGFTLRTRTMLLGILTV